MSKRTISKLAKEIGVNVETVRFYERKRLIEQPAKPETGYNRVRFIKRTQELGFSLKEIENLLKLNDSPCSQVQDLAEAKLESVADKIRDLKKLQKALNELVGLCHSNSDKNTCPVIDSLQPHFK